MTAFMSVPSLLQVAEQLPGDPAADDLGPLFAAVARHSAVALGREVYDSDHLKAAALLHTLARLECLEYATIPFAWNVAASFLRANGYTVTYKDDDAMQLAGRAARNEIKLQEISSTIRGWTTR